MLTYSGDQSDALINQDESTESLSIATNATQQHYNIPVYKEDPPGPRMTSPQNTQHIPDLLEHPVSDSVSSDQDVLVEALSTPVEPAQVHDAIFGIDRINNTKKSQNNDI